jgi:glutamate dehydrogenase/leucine dehydrogenase
VGDVAGSLYNPRGIVISDLVKFREAAGTLVGFPGAKPIQDVITCPCDVLLPCAIENAIRADNAAQIKARLVVEGANGPTTPEADKILVQKNVLVVPDILANAGGVIVSYFEWVQNREGFYWEEEEVNQRLFMRLQKSYRRVRDFAAEKKVTYRKAAYCLALEKVFRAMLSRGVQ